MSDRVYAMSEHTFYVTTHDNKTVAFNGGDEDYMLVAFENDSVTGVESAKGTVQWSKRISKKGTFTLTLQWGSIENGYLNQMYKDQLDGNYLKNPSFKRITNTENTSLYSGDGRLFIRKITDDNMGGEAAPRVWVFDAEKITADELTPPPG